MIERLERKIAAIGVRVAAGTTMHGFALNVDPDLRSFDRIIPCGLTGVGVTSMTAELGRHVTVSDVAQVLRPQLQRYLAFEDYTQSPDMGSAPETAHPQACSWRCLIHRGRVLPARRRTVVGAARRRLRHRGVQPAEGLSDPQRQTSGGRRPGPPGARRRRPRVPRSQRLGQDNDDQDAAGTDRR